MSTHLWNTARRVSAIAALAAAPLAAPMATASAQFARTGAAAVNCAFGANACDANWSVSWYGISGLTAGQSGSLANAALETAIPSPPWSPNSPTLQWIGATPNATLSPNTSGNENNYRYFFQTTFSEAVAGTLTFGLGWDNKLVGAYVGDIVVNGDGSYDASGATAILAASPGAPYAGGNSGFCRDNDGVYPSNAWPNCLTNVDLQVPAATNQRLTFVIQGDGTTDGLVAGAGTLSAVPEPSTYVLMASGLLAIGGIAARRRKS